MRAIAAATKISSNADTPATMVDGFQSGPRVSSTTSAKLRVAPAMVAAARIVCTGCQRDVRVSTPVATASRASSKATSGRCDARVRRCRVSPSRIWFAARLFAGSSGDSPARCRTQPPSAAPRSAVSRPRLDTTMVSSSATEIWSGTARSTRRVVEMMVRRQLFATTLVGNGAPSTHVGGTLCAAHDLPGLA